jgi:hypothetical protein
MRNFGCSGGTATVEAAEAVTGHEGMISLLPGAGIKRLR